MQQQDRANLQLKGPVFVSVSVSSICIWGKLRVVARGRKEVALLRFWRASPHVISGAGRYESWQWRQNTKGEKKKNLHAKGPKTGERVAKDKIKRKG